MPGVPELHFTLTHLWEAGRSEGLIPQSQGLSRNKVPEDTAWHRDTCPRAALGGQWGEGGDMPGRVWMFMSCPFKSP